MRKREGAGDSQDKKVIFKRLKTYNWLRHDSQCGFFCHVCRRFDADPQVIGERGCVVNAFIKGTLRMQEDKLEAHATWPSTCALSPETRVFSALPWA